MIKTPSKATLRKYGLTEGEWRAILDRQGGTCFICQKEPPKGVLCIDHFHAPKWKKLPPEKRKLYVRGLLCSYCNLRLLRKGWTLAKLRRAVLYVERFERQLNPPREEPISVMNPEH